MISIDPLIRPLVYVPDPRLREKCGKVVRYGRTLQLLSDRLHASMDAHGGVGLAAPQIGHSVRVIAVKLPKGRYTIVNPMIRKRSPYLTWETEVCLSIPGYAGIKVPRLGMVEVTGSDERGNRFWLRAWGFEARVLQHEIDHLDGILYIDRLKSPAQLKRVA